MRNFPVLCLLVLLGCSEQDLPSSPIYYPVSTPRPGAPPASPVSSSNGPKASNGDTTWMEAGPQGFYYNLNNPWTTYQDTSAFRYGWKSERFIVSPGDCFGYDCTRSPVYERKEFGEDDSGLSKEGDDVWYGWSFYVPLESHQSWAFFGQIMEPPENAGGQHEPLWMFFKRQGQPFCMVFDFNRNVNPWECSGYNIRLLEDTEFAGRWHDVVLHIRFSGSNGLTEVWVNGELKGRYDGYTLIPGKKGAVMKYGIYRIANSNTTIAYYDEMRKGKTREEVDIRVLTIGK